MTLGQRKHIGLAALLLALVAVILLCVLAARRDGTSVPDRGPRVLVPAPEMRSDIAPPALAPSSTQGGVIPEALVAGEDTSGQAIIAGSVSWADGHPAAEVSVVASDAGPAGAGTHASFLGFCLTDANGGFEAAVDAGTSLTLRATVASGRDVSTNEMHVVARAGERHDVRLRFPPAFVIQGVVVTPEGERCGHATVRWWRAEESAACGPAGSRVAASGSGNGGLRADEAGAFAFSADAAGAYTLLARGAESVNGTPVRVELTEAQPRATVTLAVAEPGSIAGQVLGADGVPRAGTLVRAQPAGRHFEHDQLHGPDAFDLYGDAHATTDDDGRFELSGLNPAASYRVQASITVPMDSFVDLLSLALPNVQVVEPDVRTGTLDLRLMATEAPAPGMKLTGQVLAAASRLPVEDYTVTLFGMSDRDVAVERGLVISGAPDGKFLFEGLQPGDCYALHVRGAAVPETPRAVVEGGAFVLREDTPEQLLLLPSAARLQVLVTDVAGRPVEAATVNVERLSRLPARGLSPVFTDPLGRARFGPLDPGRFCIHAARDEVAGGLVIDLGDGENASVTVTLQPEG
jgi:hypothetical protein